MLVVGKTRITTRTSQETRLAVQRQFLYETIRILISLLEDPTYLSILHFIPNGI